MNLDKEKFYEQINKIFKNYTEENKDIIKKAVLDKNNLTLQEIKSLSDMVSKNIKNENKKLGDIISETFSYISFFSFAATDKWELSPIDKSIEVLKNIKECFFLATPESLTKAEKKKEDLLMKFGHKINIKIIKISSDDYDEIYNHLENILTNSESAATNFILDNTLGFKMITGVFYKFAVEQGVKLISWQNEHCSIDERIYRIPATDKLNFLEFPQLKNHNIISNINNLIADFKFKEAKGLCEAINNFDRSILLDSLANVFNLENILNSGKFLEAIEEFLENKLILKNKNMINLYNQATQIFNKILQMEMDNNIKPFNVIYFYMGYNFIKSFLKDFKNDDDILRTLAIKTYYENFENEKSDISNLDKINFVEEELEDCWISNFELETNDLELNKSDDCPWIQNEIFLSIFSEIFDEDEITSDLDKKTKYIYNIIHLFDSLKKELEISLPKQIYLENNNLNLKKFKLNILLKDKFIRSGGLNLKILKFILNSNNYKVTKNEIDYITAKHIKLKDKSQNDEIKEVALSSKQFNDLKKFLTDFNNFIDSSLKEAGLNINSPFVIIPNENLDKLKAIRISETFMI
ncbi:hypothetical protein [Cetobacterium sp.]|uniref:hypothetical protein n=1 Tax=Cetobacterium sp. TaxID=2071632 RepID=UPI003F3C50C6